MGGTTQDGTSLPADPSTSHTDEDSNVNGAVDGSTPGTQFVSRGWTIAIRNDSIKCFQMNNVELQLLYAPVVI